MPKNPVFQVSIKNKHPLPTDSDLLIALLARLGIPYSSIVTETSKNGETIFFYLTSKRSLSSLTKKLRSLGLRNLILDVKDLSGIGWRDKWKEGYKPFRINPTFTVVPSWMCGDKKRNIEKTIFLDIGMAFGSGLHATTRFVASFMDQKKKHLGDFLDVGTGSGILSIMASKYGARSIACIDLDPESIRVARNNLIKNKIPLPLLRTCNIKDFPLKSRFDFIAANLQTKILLDSRKALISLVKPGKYLAVSGIASCNYMEFRKKFDCKALRCLRILNNKEWYAVLYKASPFS